MSEYQYYEFQALDKLLTMEQIAELRQVSTRAKITPSTFVNEYQWGDFKGNPDKWMVKYFDAFLYLANWGTRRLMLRFPAKLIDSKIIGPYEGGENFSCLQTEKHIIFSFSHQKEEPDWVDAEGILNSLTPLRSDFLRGDTRILYLFWLLEVQSGCFEDDEVEPLVPPGLKNLNPSLESFAEFFGIDPDIIDAAAEGSADECERRLPEKEFETWLRKKPVEEKEKLLLAFIRGNEMHLTNQLRQEAIEEILPGKGVGKKGERTVGELRNFAEKTRKAREERETRIRQQEKEKRDREKAEKRKKYLEVVAKNQGKIWRDVDQLIQTKAPGKYDEAVSLLEDLRDVAGIEKSISGFSVRIQDLAREHERKPSLIARFRKAKLLE